MLRAFIAGIVVTIAGAVAIGYLLLQAAIFRPMPMKRLARSRAGSEHVTGRNVDAGSP